MAIFQMTLLATNSFNNTPDDQQHMTHRFAFIIMIFTLTGNSLARDTDGDSISDSDEIKIGTSPNRKDSDGDGSTDYDEICFDCNPLDPNEKIIEIGKWQSSSKLASFYTRKAKVSYNGKIETKTDTRIGYQSHIWEKKRFQSLKEMAQAREMEQLRKNAFKLAKADNQKRENYLSMSSNYDEIKRLRRESVQFRNNYDKSKSKYDLELWNKASKALRDMEATELKIVEARISAGRYRSKNKVEKLEERIEELESELDAIRYR